MARYIKSKTTVPLPDIHAYGRENSLTRNSSTIPAFLILDFLPGRPLDLQALANDTLLRRKHFYTQLIELMAQLRKLEFASSGSLILDREEVPVLDEPLHPTQRISE